MDPEGKLGHHKVEVRCAMEKRPTHLGVPMKVIGNGSMMKMEDGCERKS